MIWGPHTGLPLNQSGPCGIEKGSKGHFGFSKFVFYSKAAGADKMSLTTDAPGIDMSLNSASGNWAFGGTQANLTFQDHNTQSTTVGTLYVNSLGALTSTPTGEPVQYKVTDTPSSR